MKQRTILLSGGGTAGHITPTLHVARALKHSDPGLKLLYVLEKGCKFRSLVEACTEIDEIKDIPAGKWRRYHGTSTMQKLLDVKTNFLNFIDLFKTFFGLLSSISYFMKRKPDAVLAKGGFVVVPVGYAARVFGTPLITHDSDTQPGLANRIISKWAKARLVVSEEAAAVYKNERTRVVGIPVDENFQSVVPEVQKTFKSKLGVDANRQLVLIVGGSLGAQRLNAAMREVTLRITAQLSNLTMLWVVGAQNLENEKKWLADQSTEVRDQVIIKDFVDNMAAWFSAADVVVSRGGATFIAEIIAATKPSIIVPAAFLPGGHQAENAEQLAKQGAAEIVHEQDDLNAYSSDLAYAVVKLLTDDKAREDMKTAITGLGQSNATEVVAEILLEATRS